jgi:hypothetical protein
MFYSVYIGTNKVYDLDVWIVNPCSVQIKY